LSHSAHVAKVSKSSLLNTTVDILAQLQSVEDVFVSDVVPSCHSLNLLQTRHLKYCTLIRFRCVVFSVQVSELYNSVLSIIVS